ncbi:hypothetical protein G6F50_014629 [Rhizopus delemar]|uniref:Uncharacterized protein n=1 Tax=Rhizopus delemar TaxID=936053 RepID=A0A9P7C6X6_9FUNG|nr:hypothetical protein G6F50_014629 [Rhizopus delemar]
MPHWPGPAAAVPVRPTPVAAPPARRTRRADRRLVPDAGPAAARASACADHRPRLRSFALAQRHRHTPDRVFHALLAQRRDLHGLELGQQLLMFRADVLAPRDKLLRKLHRRRAGVDGHVLKRALDHLGLACAAGGLPVLVAGRLQMHALAQHQLAGLEPPVWVVWLYCCSPQLTQAPDAACTAVQTVRDPVCVP